MVHYAEHGGFEHLSLDERSFDYYDRLVREGDFALAHCVDVAGELHCAEILAELCVTLAGEEFLIEIRRHLAEVQYHLHDFVGAADYSPVVVLGGLAVEEIEDCLAAGFSALQK